MSIEEQVRKIVADNLSHPVESVQLDSDLVTDLKADSIDSVELVMAVEDEFSITIPEDDMRNLKTVGDIVKYVNEKQ